MLCGETGSVKARYIEKSRPPVIWNRRPGFFIRHAAEFMDCFAVLSFYILQCSGIFFAGADLYDSVNIVYKNLAIADVTGKEYLLCSCNDGINRDLADDNLDLYLRQQGCIDFCTTVHFACTLLDAAAHYLCHGHTGYTKVV